MVNLRRPILVGGVGLSFGAWLLQSMHPAISDLGGTAVWGAIALGSGVWWLKQQTGKKLDVSTPVPLDRSQVEAVLASIDTQINQLAPELERVDAEAAAASLTHLRDRLTHLQAELDRHDLRMAIVGGTSVGKTTLSQLLNLHWALQLSAALSSVSVSDTASLFTEADPALSLPASVPDTDLVLFVTAGDLTQQEYEALQQLITQGYRVLLLFNKQDQYLPSERPTVLHQLRERIKAELPIEDVLAIATNPAAVKVRQHQPDGTVAERLEQPTPDLTPLTDRLGQLIAHHRQQLILATVMRQAGDLKQSIQAELNRIRRDRAMPLVEQYQWIAATAAFANPVPSLDLLATAAINTQLIVDLGAIYHQSFSVEQAKTVAVTLASQMLKLGLVEMTTQAGTHFLKSNALTYVAGGLLQGVSAAYLTRLAGLSLVEYFEEQSATPTTDGLFQVDRFTQKLKAVFQDNQRTVFMKTLVKQAIDRLTPEPSHTGVEIKAGA
ncbi:slr1306 family protein [Oculatella sp. LEGE 06141]|uniref:slr1306 family protein n=1 Tax=Oculatella sp. LEGE 06141 TaxID=1828648 RepID=UPI001D14418E|nr:DUF697 domain-containing protein [Oculatella sp. LEGE 06141]